MAYDIGPTTAARPEDLRPTTLGDVWTSSIEDARKVTNQNAAYELFHGGFNEVNEQISRATGKSLSNPLGPLEASFGDVFRSLYTRGKDIETLSGVEAWKKEIEGLRVSHPDALDWDEMLATPARKAWSVMKATRENANDVSERRGLADGSQMPGHSIPYVGPFIGAGGALVANMMRDPAAQLTQIAAGLAGSLSSPIDTGVNLISFGAGGKAVSIARNAALNASINMAAQVPLSALKMDDYKAAGLPYGWKVWAEEVAGAGVAGGLLDAGVRAPARLYRVARGTGAGQGGVFRDAVTTPELPSPPPVREPIAPEVFERARQNDIEAIREIATKSGAIEDPLVKGALDFADMGGKVDAEALRALRKANITHGESVFTLNSILMNPTAYIRLPDPIVQADRPMMRDEAMRLSTEREADLAPVLSAMDSRISRLVSDGVEAGIPSIVEAVRDVLSGPMGKVAETSDRLAKAVEVAAERIGGMDRLAAQVMIHTGQNPVGVAEAMRAHPDLVDSNVNLDSNFMRMARALQALDQNAWAEVRGGLANPALAAEVANFAPPGQHRQVLEDLSKAAPGTLEQARAVIPDLIRKDGPAPLARPGIDDPAGPEAEAQTKHLEERHKEAVDEAMAPIKERKKLESKVEDLRGEIAKLEEPAKPKAPENLFAMGDRDAGQSMRRDLGDFDTNEYGYRAMAEAMGRSAPQGDPSVSATRWSKALDNPNGPETGEKVLFIGDDPAGLVTAYRDKDKSIRITSVSVLNSVQRKGYGTLLIGDLLREFPEATVSTNMRTGAGKALFAPFDDGTGHLRPAKVKNGGASLFAIPDKSLSDLAKKRSEFAIGDEKPKTKGLNMSPEARKKRAEAMGFDTGVTYFRGTMRGAVEDFGWANRNSPDGVSGDFDAVFITRQSNEANGYTGVLEYDTPRYEAPPTMAQRAGLRPMPDMVGGRDTGSGGGAVYPLYAKRMRKFVWDYSNPDATNAKVQAVFPGYEPTGDAPNLRQARELQDALEAAGYEALSIVDGRTGREAELAVFNPANVRSVNAAFDPANAASPNLLYAIPDANLKKLAKAREDLADAEAGIDTIKARGTPELYALVMEARAVRRERDMVRAIDDALRLASRILPEGTAVRVTDALESEGVRLDASSDTRTGDIALATYALNPAARLGHEGVHTLVTRGLVSPAEVGLLEAAGREAGLLKSSWEVGGKSFATEDAAKAHAKASDIAEDAIVPRGEAAYRKAYKDRASLEQQVSEEFAAHYVEAVIAGKIEKPDTALARIVKAIQAAIERVKNAMSGAGYKTADDIAAAILNGEAARRAPAQRWMRANDITAMAVKPDRGFMAAMDDRGTGSDDVRLHRAKQLGFDTSKVWYHGTSATPFDAFTGRPVHGGKTPVIWLSPDTAQPDAQLTGGTFYYDSLTPEGARMIAAYVRPGRQLVVDAAGAGPFSLGQQHYKAERETEYAKALGAVNERLSSPKWLPLVDAINTIERYEETTKDASYYGEEPDKYLNEGNKHKGRVIRLYHEFSKSHPDIHRQLETAARHKMSTSTVIDEAASQGYTSILFKDMVDNAGRQDQLVMLRPEDIRAVHAEFSPWGVASGNLMFAMADRETGQSMRRDLDALGFYSKLDEVLSGFGPKDKVTVATLQQRGVKLSEIEARGLKDALDGGKSAPVSDLLATAGRNKVELREVKYTGEREALRKQIGRLTQQRHDSNGNLRQDVLNEIKRLNDQLDRSEGEGSRWQVHSLDPSNPSYRETVIHLPRPDNTNRVTQINDELRRMSPDDPRFEELAQERARLHDEGQKNDAGFVSGHFSEPNIVGHMMTSMVKHDGKPVYLIDQIQSDWGQKLRDGGVRDEAKASALRKEIDERFADLGPGSRIVGHPDSNTPPSLAERRALSPERFQELNRLMAELRTASVEGAVGHPLVNTTDQWTTTTLRRAIRQAAEADADYIAIPSGDTVLSYNPGDTEGMRGFYDGIVPKNLRNILGKIDKASPAPQKVATLDTPSKGAAGSGFTLFPLTDTVKVSVREQGQAMFAIRDDAPVFSAELDLRRHLGPAGMRMSLDSAGFFEIAQRMADSGDEKGMRLLDAWIAARLAKLEGGNPAPRGMSPEDRLDRIEGVTGGAPVTMVPAGRPISAPEQRPRVAWDSTLMQPLIDGYRTSGDDGVRQAFRGMSAVERRMVRAFMEDLNKRPSNDNAMFAFGDDEPAGIAGLRNRGIDSSQSDDLPWGGKRYTVDGNIYTAADSVQRIARNEISLPAADELSAAAKLLDDGEIRILTEAFGGDATKAKRWKELWNIAERNGNGPLAERADAERATLSEEATGDMDNIEIGDAPTIRSMLSVFDDMEKHPEEIADILVPHLAQLPLAEKSPAVWSLAEAKAVAIMRKAGFEMDVNGLDVQKISRELQTKYTSYFSDPADAMFMVEALRASIVNRSKQAALQKPGAMFAFAGERARTADLGSLAKAKQMEGDGFARNDIRQATGWFRAPGKNWIFEISDIGAKLKGGRGKLGEVLDHPELFKAYPELKNIPVGDLPASAPKEARGAYLPKIDKAGFIRRLLGAANAQMMLGRDVDRSSVLHETQHAVDDIEGALTGIDKANPYGQKVDANSAAYRDAPFEIAARAVQSRADMTQEELASRAPWLDYGGTKPTQGKTSKQQTLTPKQEWSRRNDMDVLPERLALEEAYKAAYNSDLGEFPEHLKGRYNNPDAIGIHMAIRNLAAGSSSPKANAFAAAFDAYRDIAQRLGHNGGPDTTTWENGPFLYAFAGEKARTADLDALARAKEMEAQGKDRTAIWTDTGWFNFRGEWLFEGDATPFIDALGDKRRAYEKMFGPLFGVDSLLHLTDQASRVGIAAGVGGMFSPWAGAAAGGVTATAVMMDHIMQLRDFYKKRKHQTSTHGDPALASAVQKRAAMSRDERRSRAPWLDYDVPEDQQIVRFANGDAPDTGKMFALNDNPPPLHAEMEAIDHLGSLADLAKACRG